MSDDKVPASQSSSWAAFIKSIASFNGDLSSLTAPPFILSPVSLTEFSQYWNPSRELFLAAAEEQDQEQRFLKVVRWFIATLKIQYCTRSIETGSEKKPLNPVLLEAFTGVWKHDSGDKEDDVLLVSEQVSHHPPVTAYSLWNEKNKVKVEGYNQIKAGFSAPIGIAVKQYGHALYTLEALNETYMITLPNLHLEGLVTGAPYVELEGKSYIQSSTGYKATIEYSGKGYFSGKKNSFSAKVVKNADPKNVLYTLKGQWSGESKIKHDVKGTDEVFLDATKLAINHDLSVKPIEQQSEMESRKLWSKVAAAIQKGDYNEIHLEKSKIENEQRELRKKEAAENIVPERRWFKQVPVFEEAHYQELCTKAGVVAGPSHSSSSTTTSGADPKKDVNWRFVKESFHKGEIKPPQ